MKIPKNMTEADTIATIEKVAGRIAHKFIFGYHTYEDIKQQAIFEGIKGLKNYDEVRPLENFLSIHIKNRLCNFKRDNFVRMDKPCDKCPFDAYIKFEDKCSKFDNMNNCELYSYWSGKDESKRNIMSPVNINIVVDEHEHNMRDHEDPGENAELLELVNLIDLHIPLLLRSDWLKLKNSLKISKMQRAKVIAAITIIFEENNIDAETYWSSYE